MDPLRQYVGVVAQEIPEELKAFCVKTDVDPPTPLGADLPRGTRVHLVDLSMLPVLLVNGIKENSFRLGEAAAEGVRLGVLVAAQGERLRRVETARRALEDDVHGQRDKMSAVERELMAERVTFQKSKRCLKLIIGMLVLVIAVMIGQFVWMYLERDQMHTDIGALKIVQDNILENHPQGPPDDNAPVPRLPVVIARECAPALGIQLISLETLVTEDDDQFRFNVSTSAGFTMIPQSGSVTQTVDVIQKGPVGTLYRFSVDSYDLCSTLEGGCPAEAPRVQLNTRPYRTPAYLFEKHDLTIMMELTVHGPGGEVMTGCLELYHTLTGGDRRVLQGRRSPE